jgi:hypothetical protein
MAVPAIGGNYEGKLSNTDATAMTGTWTQGPAPLPLNLTHATDKTAWAIPDPPAPPKVMAADAKPSFEVATIKPAKPDQGMSFLVNRSGMLNSTGTTLSFLIKFAYDVHPRQISKGPAWFETEKYDITAKPDIEGIPSLPQLKMMVQKMLAERFQLSFHRDKKELPVYGLSVAKTGVKMTKDDSNPNSLPGFGGGGVRGLPAIQCAGTAGGGSDWPRRGSLRLPAQVDAGCLPDCAGWRTTRRGVRCRRAARSVRSRNAATRPQDRINESDRRCSGH